MQVYSSRVQSTFSRIFITKDYLKLIHGVRICWSFFTGFDFFLCFYQGRRKGQCFIALQAENFFGKVIFKPEVCKSFVTLFYHMTASPLPSSAYSPVEGSTQPKYVLQCLKCYKLTFCLYYMYCYWRRNCIYYIFYSGEVWEPSFQSPKRGGTPRNCLLCYIWRRVKLNVLSLIQLDFICTVPATSTVLLPTLMWPENKFPESWEDFHTLLSHFGIIHQCSLDFKCLSLFIVCTSKYFSCFMWMWPENPVSRVPQRRVPFP